MNHTLIYALTATTLSAALAAPFLAVLWQLRLPGANARKLLRAGMLGGVAAGVGCMVGASIVVLRTYEPELWQLFLFLPVIGLLFGACVAGALVAAYLTKKHRGSTKAVSFATTLWIAAIISPALFLRPSDIHGVRGTVYVGGPTESGAGEWRREAGVLVFVDRGDGHRQRFVLDSTGTVDIRVPVDDRPNTSVLMCKPGYEARVYRVPTFRLGKRKYYLASTHVNADAAEEVEWGVPAECGGGSRQRASR